MTTLARITPAEKIAAVEQTIATHSHCSRLFSERQRVILEAVLADLRGVQAPHEGNPRIRLAWRWGAESMREQAAQVADKAFEEYRGIIAEEIAASIRTLPVE